MAQMFDVDAFRNQQRDTAMPTFRVSSVYNERESKKTGKPVYDNVEMIQIITPGDKLTVVDGPVKEYHRRRFSVQYDAWKRGEEAPTVGTPLSTWAQCSPADVAVLKSSNVKTVEQLAEMPEANRPQMPNFHDLQKKAQEFLKVIDNNAAVTAMQTMVEDQKKEISHLNNVIDALRKKVSEQGIEEDIPKRRGRPPKRTE